MNYLTVERAEMVSYSRRAKILRAMGHPVRLQILEVLVSRPACVCELMVRTGRRQACISQHMMLLRQTGLVKGTRIGKNMRYELAAGSIGGLLKVLLHEPITG